MALSQTVAESAAISHKNGNTFFLEGAFEKANASYRKAVQLRAPLLADTTAMDSLLWYKQGVTIRNIGNANLRLDNYRQALDSFFCALKIFQQLGNSRGKLLCYHGIRLVYMKKKDVYSAMHWLEKAIEQNDGTLKEYALSLDAGILHENLNQYEKAIQILETALQSNRKSYAIYNALGNSYDGKKEFQLALINYRLALNYAQSRHDNMKILNNIGQVHMDLVQYDSTEHYLKKAEALCLINDHSNLNTILHNYSDFYLRQDRFEQAVDYIDQAIAQLSQSHQTVPSLSVGRQALENIPTIIQDFRLKGNAYFEWYKKTEQPRLLDSAYHCYQEFNALMQLMQKDFVNESSELFWLSQFYTSIEAGLEVGFEKQKRDPKGKEYVDFMLDLIEQNKANILLENLKKISALDKAQLPSKTSTPIYKQIQDDLLDSKSAFLTYFVGDSSVFLICITSRNKRAYRLDGLPVDSLGKSVQGIRQLLDTRSSDFTAFAHYSEAIYTHFLKQALQDLPSEINTLIIAPDGPLSFVPFDILLLPDQVGTSYFDSKYLIHDKTITYAYSADVLLQQTRKSAAFRDLPTVYAFAPSFERYEQLEALTNSEELLTIEQWMPVTSFKGEQATVEQYNQSRHHQVIHLATHASVHPSNSDSTFIYFSDHPLPLKAVYPHHNNAEMIVLSACETGVGNYKRGEGVMSLARAFAYSGIPSTTMSLWSADDRATSTIMGNYYQHLSTGHPKPEALRLAKLDYLNGSIPKSNWQPFYWASFVLYGASVPLYEGSVSYVRYLLLILLVGVVVWWWLQGRAGLK